MRRKLKGDCRRLKQVKIKDNEFDQKKIEDNEEKD